MAQTPVKLTIGTTGVVLHPHMGVDGKRFQKAVIDKCLVRVGVREALAAGTHTAWFKASGSTVALTAPIFSPDTVTNPTTSVAISGTIYGPFIDGDTFGISSTGDQANKEVYIQIIPL